VLLEYARLAFVNMRDLVDWGASGITLKDSSSLSLDDTAAVLEVTERVIKGGTETSIKLCNKISALDALSKHLNVFDGSGGEKESDLDGFDHIDKALDETTANVWEEDTNRAEAE
jgi:hypothetical protein